MPEAVAFRDGLSAESARRWRVCYRGDKSENDLDFQQTPVFRRNTGAYEEKVRTQVLPLRLVPKPKEVGAETIGAVILL